MASKEATNYNNDSIIIEDSPAASTRKSTRKSPLDVVNTSSTKLCEFPVDQSDTVTVSSQDYATLEHDTFLNDIIIDFYLTHLFYNILPSESRASVHIFSTMFYKRLLQTPKKDAKKVAVFETDLSLSKEEKQHLRVAGWTKNVDLFKKDFVIIPICENSHWYLVVVVKPGKVNITGERTSNPVESEKRVDTLEEVKKTTDTPEESENKVDTLEDSKTTEESEKKVDSLEESENKVDTLEDSKTTEESEKKVDTLEDLKKTTDTTEESEKRVVTLVDAGERTDTSKDSERRTDNEVDFAEDSEERTNSVEVSERMTDEGEPFFLVFDSLGGIKRSAVTNIKNYLSYEWRCKMCCKDDQAKELLFSNEQIKTFHPKKPEQENWSDCGIFLLHYVEKMFQDLDQFLQPGLPDLSDWFTIEEVSKKRAAIAVLIRRLAKQQEKEGELPNFPNIKFKDESKARKSPKLMDSFSSKDIYSPIKDVNENVNKNEEVGGMKVIRSNSSKVTTRSSFSQKGPLLKSSKRASPTTSKESDTRSSDTKEDFTFDPSKYPDATAICSEMSESTKCSSEAASAISSRVSTTSSAPSNPVAMSSSSAAKSATNSSNSSGRNLASGTSANFMEVWNATKNNLVIGDYARFASTSTTKNDGKGKRKRFGLETFKSLQQEAANDGNLSSRNSSDAPEMLK